MNSFNTDFRVDSMPVARALFFAGKLPSSMLSRRSIQLPYIPLCECQMDAITRLEASLKADR